SEKYAECDESMVFQATTLFMSFSIPQIEIKVKYRFRLQGFSKGCSFTRPGSQVGHFLEGVRI
ncbi:MAG: hypothetical protein ACXVDN_06710, partial [Ktedonobacteraceae bacterium]